MTVVALGDVGLVDGMMHIGDEAMFEALVGELGARRVDDIVAISAAPEETAPRYGVDAVARVGFPAERPAARARFEAIQDAVAGRRSLPSDDPVWAVIDAVATSDGVVVTGGGNLASTWPQHVFERAALARIAAAHGKPLVMSGQTLGPSLVPEDRELVADLLSTALRVGLREPDSWRLALDLGAPPERAILTVDDATFLGFLDPAPAGDLPIVVSLSSYLGGHATGSVVAGLAQALDSLHAETGMPLVFHAHFGSLDPGVARGDAVLHERVRAALRSESTVVPTGEPRDAARLAHSAGMLVTGRYHPAVFAAPAGVPITALVADAYTAVKLRGALGHWGQTGWIDLDTVARGVAGASFVEIAHRRDAIARATADAFAAHRARADAWWDDVARTLS